MDSLWCNYYKKSHHRIDKCWKLHSKPLKHGQSKGKDKHTWQILNKQLKRALKWVQQKRDWKIKKFVGVMGETNKFSVSINATFVENEPFLLVLFKGHISLGREGQFIFLAQISKVFDYNLYSHCVSYTYYAEA